MYDPFHLVLTVNHACNLRCTYCYTGSKFSRKMPREIGCRAIERAIRSIREGGTLELGFFGGEPLIEAGLIDFLLDHAHRLAGQRGIRVIPGLTTNGTITTDLAWSIMTRPGLELAISHDGLPAVHDRHRLSADGMGTSGVVEATIRRLIDLPKDFCVVMVVRPDTVDQLADGIDYLRSLGVRRIEPSIDLWTFWCRRDIERLERMIQRCAVLWRQGLPAGSIGWFDEKVPGLLGIDAGRSGRCGFGAGQIAVAPSGRLYACERLIGEDSVDHPSAMPGHVMEGADFLDCIPAPSRAHPECDQCPVQQLCNTTCRCSNVVRSGDPRKPDELLCVWNQACLSATADELTKLSSTEVLH